jgi:AraC family transcriptional regulator, transcriptional activator FtrA
MEREMQTTGPLVVTVAYDGLCTFELGVAVEVFALPRPEMGRDWYQHRLAAIEDGPLKAAGGFTFAVHGGLELVEQADIIIIPGWRGIDAPVPKLLVEALRLAHNRRARLLSLCSGVRVIAETGLLDGRRATTHWRYVETISALHPKITFLPDVLYVDEGDVMTAAGTAAGLDLCLHMIRKDYGPVAANSVARRLVVQPHRDGGQAQYIQAPVPRIRESGRLSPLLDWIRLNLDKDLSIAVLATKAGMSHRTLQRRFEETTGVTPGEWILRARIDHAKSMLEIAGSVELEDVAIATGFGSGATLRHHFRNRLGTTPNAYRRQFSLRGSA